MELQEKIQVNVPEDKIEMLFYTNNNSLKVYLSRDAIVCNERMETDNYDISFSNFIDKGLIITHKKLPENLIMQNLSADDTIRPIILRLTIENEDVQKIPLLIIDKDFNVRWTTIKEYNYQTDIAAFIIGHIPFNYVSGIHFSNNNDRRAFYSLLQNVSYPDELYRDGFDIFPGEEFEIDLSKLNSVINQGLLLQDFNLFNALAVVRIRDRIKAMLLSVISTFEIISGFYKINFDKFILEIIDENVNDVINEFKRRKIHIFREDISSTNDSTPFPYLIEIIQHIVTEKNDMHIWLNEHKQRKSELPKEEIIGYHLAIQSLINKDFESYNQIKWFEEFKVEFINSLLEAKSRKDIVEKYRNKIAHMSEIFDGKAKIADFLNDKKNESKFLNGLLLFVKGSVSNDSSRWIDDMDNFRFDPYEKRMTWVLYAALKGTAFLGKEMKSNALLNRISDEISLILTANDCLISDVCSLGAFIKYREINDSTIKSKKGYPILVEESLNAEVFFNYLNDYIAPNVKENNDNMEELLKLISEMIAIPEKYYIYTYTLPKSRFKLYQDDNQLILTSYLKATEEKQFLKQEYVNQIIKDIQKFSFEYENQKEKWWELVNILRTK